MREKERMRERERERESVYVCEHGLTMVLSATRKYAK